MECSDVDSLLVYMYTFFSFRERKKKNSIATLYVSRTLYFLQGYIFDGSMTLYAFFVIITTSCDGSAVLHPNITTATAVLVDIHPLQSFREETPPTSGESCFKRIVQFACVVERAPSLVFATKQTRRVRFSCETHLACFVRVHEVERTRA